MGTSCTPYYIQKFPSPITKATHNATCHCSCNTTD